MFGTIKGLILIKLTQNTSIPKLKILFIFSTFSPQRKPLMNKVKGH